MTQRQDHPVRGSKGGRSWRSWLLALAVVTPTLVAACGSAGTPPATDSPSASTAVSATPGNVPTSASGASPTGSPTGSLTVSGSVSGTTTLVGTVTEGVENQCVVLVDDSGTTVANLLGWDLQAHPAGSTVEVTGTFEEGLMTTCQQGRPFTVAAVVAR